MKRLFVVRYASGSYGQFPGIDAPVAGLAVVQMPVCDCGRPLVSVVHVRSGVGLFFTHSAESLGRDVWDALGEVDWTCSARELDHDVTDVVVRAWVLVPDAFGGSPAPDLDDVPEADRVPGSTW